MASNLSPSAVGFGVGLFPGGDLPRVRQEASERAAQVRQQRTAADAAGIGQTNAGRKLADREADGRLSWQRSTAAMPRSADDPTSFVAVVVVEVGKLGQRLDVAV